MAKSRLEGCVRAIALCCSVSGGLIYGCGDESATREGSPSGATGGTSNQGAGHTNAGGSPNGSGGSATGDGGNAPGNGGSSAGDRGSGGSSGNGGDVIDGGGGRRDSDDAGSESGTGSKLVWPNETSFANSDPWLKDHHTEIREIHPRILLIDFANGNSDEKVLARYQQQKDAMMEGSRYHAYSNPSAKPFFIYELAKHVSLKDNSGVNSAKFPRR